MSHFLDPSCTSKYNRHSLRNWYHGINNLIFFPYQDPADYINQQQKRTTSKRREILQIFSYRTILCFTLNDSNSKMSLLIIHMDWNTFTNITYFIFHKTRLFFFFFFWGGERTPFTVYHGYIIVRLYPWSSNTPPWLPPSKHRQQQHLYYTPSSSSSDHCQIFPSWAKSNLES